MNVTLLEAKLLTIKYGINYASQLQDILCIIIVTNSKILFLLLEKYLI